MNILARILNYAGVHLQYRLRIDKFNYDSSGNIHPNSHSEES